MRHLAILMAMASAIGCSKGERWSKEDWAKTLGAAEGRLRPPPSVQQSPSCSSNATAGKCFLDPDERTVRYAVLVDAVRLQAEWTGRLCEQIASRTKRAAWPALADGCAQARARFVTALRGSGDLDDAALVTASERDGKAEYVRFLAGLGAQLGDPKESAWHQELRVAASRRVAVPQLAFPLSPAGCAGTDVDARDCASEQAERLRHRTEILTNFLHGWIGDLWSACDARAAATSTKDLPALASACLDYRDFVTTLAIKGIGLKDDGLIECRGLSLEQRDWPTLISDRVASKDAPTLIPGKPSVCGGDSVAGKL